jgi:glycosyltransferase involved in cell wall biosynthesis
MPLVSVIIPTYNRSRLVKEAIESVLSQTYTNFEILVIDDGSIDDTGEEVKKIKDSRIRYFYKQNGGIASARNAGVDNSKGKYIALLDSDDLYTEKYLEIMTGRLEENTDFGLAYSMFINILPDGTRENGLKEDRFLSGTLIRNYFQKMPCILPSATVLRKEAINGFYFDENIKLGEDIDFFLRLSVKTKFLCVPETTVLRRFLKGNISEQYKTKISPSLILILERFFRHMNNNGIVPASLARKKIGREYRSLARTHAKAGNRKASIKLIKKAIKYYPFDNNYYKFLLRVLFMSRKKDKTPNWQMPEPLPPYIVALGKKIQYSVQDK